MAKITKEDLMQAIEEMSVLELSELVKALEEKFGVSAAVAMATAAPAALQRDPCKCRSTKDCCY
jgi:ribosomal protein L7/L12